MPGFPKSLLSPKSTPACFCIRPSIPRLGFIFSWIKQNLLSALCRKRNPWTAPWRGKLGIMKQTKRKRGKPNFWEKKNHFPPRHSCSSISVCCGHHTPDSLHFRHLIEMNSWRELRGVPPTLQWSGEGSGDGEAKNVSPVCPVLLSPAVPYLSHTVGG